MLQRDSIPFHIILAVFKALFSGVPIQASQLFLKIGFLINTIEGVGQCLSCGSLFIILQLKEFLYSYFSLSDVMIGSIFYFTTGLHGFHVLFGSFGFFLTLWLIISPSLIILLEFDLILIPSFIIYSLGYQWAWSFNLSFTLSFLKVLVSNVGTINNVAVMNSFLGILGCSYYFDHYIISSFFLSNCSSYYYPCIFLLSNILSSFYYSQSFCFGLIWGLRNLLVNSIFASAIQWLDERWSIRLVND